ncbi:MAG: hypothetical protein WCI03_09485, partial [bacterium]
CFAGLACVRFNYGYGMLVTPKATMKSAQMAAVNQVLTADFEVFCIICMERVRNRFSDSIGTRPLRPD